MTILVHPAWQYVSVGVAPVPSLSSVTHTTLPFVVFVWVNQLAVSPVAQLPSLETLCALFKAGAGNLRLWRFMLPRWFSGFPLAVEYQGLLTPLASRKALVLS